MAKDDGNTKSKKKDASSVSLSGLADASGLRRSNREIPSKKQATASPSASARRSERIEHQTTPSSSPIKKKPDKFEEQMGPSSLRRSDRSKKQLSPSGSKKLVEVPASSNIESKKEKIASNPKEDAGDVSVEKKIDNKIERQDPDDGGRKRKRMTVRGYKALFKPQILRIEAEDGQDSDVQHTPTESGNGEKQIGGKRSQDNNGKISPIESGKGEKQIAGKCSQDDNGKMSPIENCNGEKQIGGKCSQDNNGKMSSQNMDIHSCSKEQSINGDLKNQQELETCDKILIETPTSEVRNTCQESTVMENTESNDAKFVEFWVPVQISNVQLEQYCSTLLSGAMALRSCSKSDSFGALHNILLSNRKCCDHPYLVDKDIQTLITKDQPQNIHFDLGYKSSGKVHFLDLILPEVKKRKLRVVILFQPSVATGSGTSTSIGIGDILDDFVEQRFGADCYERVDGGARMRMEYKQAALNNFNEDKNKFILLLERHAFQPSIKLSSVDIIIIFDSSLNPANDTKALQKMSINSNSEQIMIFRLYSKNTLEEQIVKLAEQNVPLDSKLQNLSRITCDALLMWGVKDLFQKLDTFHGKSGKDISSEERFLKDVKEEFLYIISDKYKSKDREKSMITKVQNCGYYGNKNMPYGEIKTQLSDGERPHVFWRNLLEGKYPRWKFVPVSSSRQRKRPQYYGDTPDTIATVADAVKRRKKSPASKPVIENETGGANEGAHNESQSSSGGHFWSITISTAESLSDFLKPTVYDLCTILKFPVDVTNTVENFLAFVLKNYNVSKEHKSTLQAFLISLCWIGASLAKHKIGRSESFDIAKKHLNFNCKEEEANSVYLKLGEAKERFLEKTENQEKHDALNDSKSPPQAVCTESTEQKMSQESQHDQNVEKSESLETVEKQRDEIEKSKREWDEKKVNLENDCELEKRVIRALYKNPSTRSEKLKSLDKELANKLEEHERNKDIHLKELKATLLTADVAADVAAYNELPLCGSGDSKQGVGSCDKPETSVTVGNPEGGGDKMTEMPMELDGGKVQDQSKERGSLGFGDEIESTCSHTSEKQMVDATVESSLPFVEIPPHQHDTADDDVAGVLNGETPGKQCDEIENNVAENAATIELRMPEVDSNQENGEDETINSDHGETPGKQCDEIENNVAENAATVELGMPEVDSNQENGEDETINSDKSLAGEEQNDSCGSSSSNQPSAGDTPSVQPIASQAPDDQMPTILESENESLLEQLLDLGIREKEGEADPDLLARINSEEPHDDPMAENELDTHPANELLPETTHENDANTPGTVNDQQSVEQHNSTQNSEPPETTNQNTSQPEINMFNLPNQVLTRIPNHGDPLQAEMERLFAYKDNVAKFYADMKRRLKSDCEKEIAEMIAQINLKYEAKYKEAEAAFELKKKELDTTVNRVVMNKILAEAFRAKCQDLNPSGPRMQKVSVSQAGLMQELHRFSVRPSIDVASSSPGQSSGRQQTPPPPPLPQSPPQPPPPQPPLQIVHQPAALFSSTVSRPSTNTNLRPPSTTPIRPPPTINPVTPTSRPPPNITPNTRPPPTITPVTPTTRPPPNITPLTPSAGNLRAPAPHLRPLVNSDVRASAPLTSSAGSLRAPAPHLRPLVNSDVRAPAPHMRPLVSGEIRAPAPHIRPYKPSTSASPELTPVHRRMLPGQHVTSPPNSQPPLPTPSIPPLPPLPPEASYVPPPPPPPSPPPSASSWQPSRSQWPQPPPPPKSTAPPPQNHQHPPLPRIPQIPTSQTGLSSTFPRPDSGGAGYDLLDLTDIFPEDNARPSSGLDLVCLSDDD